MWLNFFNFDLKIIRQGSVSIICEKSLKILTLSMLKHAEMGCQKSADSGSPRVEDVLFDRDLKIRQQNQF